MMRNGDDVLWEATKTALMNAQWAEARAGLDELNTKHPKTATDCLPVLLVAPEHIHDRVRLWNRAALNRAGVPQTAEDPAMVLRTARIMAIEPVLTELAIDHDFNSARDRRHIAEWVVQALKDAGL